MNIGIIGKNISDIKLFLDTTHLSINNYYYIYNDVYENILDMVNYLINDKSISVLILMDNNIDTKDIQIRFKNLLILNIVNIIYEYINDFNMFNKVLLISDYKIKNLNYINIDKDLVNKKDSVIVKNLKSSLNNIYYKYDYILSPNSKINELLCILDININVLKISTILKYILSKYNNKVNSNEHSNIYIYTTSNKMNLKERLLNSYNIDLGVEFINPTKNYLININNFSGPLDLLLNLVKESNMDIYDINVSEITDQYLRYIKKMEELNINIASSYLVIASELMYLKSNELLPKKENVENVEEELTREELINRLVEYKKYKEVTSYFKEMEFEASKYLMKLPTKLEMKNDELDNSIALDDLVLAFNKFLQRKIEDEPLKTTVTRKEYSVHDRCLSIKNILRNNGQVNFSDLFDVRSTSYVVVSFLSILELLKKGDIYLIQNNIFDNIVIGIRDGNNE